MRRATRVRERLRRDLLIQLPAARAAYSKSSAAKLPRRSQATRSFEARERLLKATIQVLVDRGYTGLTTKEVATRAGLSNGALVHHYRTKAELIMTATAYVYDRAIEKGRKIANSAQAKQNPLNAFIDDCMNVYFEWPFIAAVEVLMVARTDPILMAQIEPLMQRYRRVMNEIWLATFTRAGENKQHASFLLLTTLNMIRGMAVNSLWQRNIAHYKDLLREWSSLVKRGAVKDGRIDISAQQFRARKQPKPGAKHLGIAE